MNVTSRAVVASSAIKARVCTRWHRYPHALAKYPESCVIVVDTRNGGRHGCREELDGLRPRCFVASPGRAAYSRFHSPIWKTG